MSAFFFFFGAACALGGATLVGARLLPVQLHRPTSIERALTLRGNLLPMGIYATSISVGTPPRAYEVTVDTGSTDLLLPVAGCRGCKKGTPTYDPQSSSSASPVPCTSTSSVTCKSCSDSNPKQCGFSDTYLTCDLSNLTATCTVRGAVYHDIVEIAPGLQAPAVFGGIDFQTKNFDQFQAVDGILGLAFRKLGFAVSPFESVAETGAADDVVQTCLTPTGGLLVFGTSPSDSKYYDGALAWTPIIQKSWYTIYIDTLDVAGKDVGVHGVDLNGPADDACIVDSGTNFLSLTEKAFKATRASFEALCVGGTHLPGICNVTKGAGFFDGASVKLSESEVAEFPEVKVTMRGKVSIPVGGKEYLVPTPGHPSHYTLGITQGDCIIGNVHMLKYWVSYDRTNMRVGFAPLRAGACTETYNDLMAQRAMPLHHEVGGASVLV